MSQFDDAIELQLDMMRASAGIERDVLRILLKMQRDLVASLSGPEMTAIGKARVNAQIKQVQEAISEYYGKVSEVTAKSTSAIAEVSARVTASALATDALLPSMAALEAIAASSIVQGAAMSDWWARQSADTAFRYSQAVRQGVASGQTNQQIIAQVRGFLDVSRSNAAALVQTGVSTVSNDARMAVFEKNESYFEAYVALETLDSKTCLECAAADLKRYDKDKKPIGHSIPYKTTPRHFNCRGTYTVQVFDDGLFGTRASDGGQVDANLSFEGWLSRQTKEKQADILGKGRAELYRDKKLTLKDLVDGRGNPITIDDLRSKYK